MKMFVMTERDCFTQEGNLDGKDIVKVSNNYCRFFFALV